MIPILAASLGLIQRSDDSQRLVVAMEEIDAVSKSLASDDQNFSGTVTHQHIHNLRDDQQVSSELPQGCIDRHHPVMEMVIAEVKYTAVVEIVVVETDQKAVVETAEMELATSDRASTVEAAQYVVVALED